MIDILLKKQQGSFLVNTAFTAGGSDTTALFGHSGAGKTSVINMISGLSRPDAGHIVINGRTVFDSSKKIHLPPEKRRFGYVFQEGRLFPHLSVKSNLKYGMTRIPKKERFIHMDQVVDLLGIAHLMDRQPATLSGGEKQRVAIGRALLSSPLLLLMDEPLASLDAARKKEVLPFIAKLSKQLSIPIFYVSHALNEVIHLADTIVFLEAGQVQAAGPLSEILNREDCRHLSGRSGSGTLLNTTVVAHDRETRLTKLSFSGQTLTVPIADLDIGSTTRVWIKSRNVGLSLEKINRSSFQNIFKGTITAMREDLENGLSAVTVDIGVPLAATITRYAADQLGLQTGETVWVFIKSISVSFGSSLFDSHSPKE